MSRALSILRFIVIAGAALGLLAPVVWSSFTLFPFVWGKVLWLRLIVTIAAPALVGLWVMDPASRPARSRPHFLILVGAVSLILSTVFAIDPHQSFWGRDERVFGTLAWMYFGAYYFILLAAFQMMRRSYRVLQWAACIALINVAWAGMETAFPAFWHTLRGGVRAIGTIGNPIFLGSYLLLSAFLALMAAWTTPSRRARIIFIAISGLQILGMMLTGTRGALLGFIIGIIAFAGILVIQKTHSRRRFLTGLAAAAVLFWIVFAVGGRSVPALGRLRDLVRVDATTTQRVLLFKTAARGVLARPLLGWGPENFDYLFDQHFDPKFLLFSVRESWADRAHNIFFDLLATQGALGVITAVGTLAAFVAVGFRAVRKGTLTPGAGAAAAGLLGAYLGQGAAVFDTLTTVIPMLLAAAYIAARAGSRAPDASHVGRFSLSVASAGVVGAVLVAFFVVGSIRPAIASWHVLLARGLADPTQKLEHGRVGLSIRQPYRDDFRLRQGNMVFAAENVTSELSVHTESELRVAVRNHPRDYALRLTLANIVLMEAIDRDSSRFSDAEQLFLEAAEYSPRRQTTWLQLGNQKLIEKDPAAALRYYEKARDFDPAVGEPWWHIGRVYGDADDALRAHEAFERARRHGFMSNLPGELNLALKVYEAVGDYRGMLLLFTQLFGVDHPGAAEYGGLAEILAHAGDEACARRVVARTVELDPTAASDAELFLAAMARGEYLSPTSTSAHSPIDCDKFFNL